MSSDDFTLIDRVTAGPITTVPMANEAEADAVMAAAHAAFPAWRDVALGKRARLPQAFAATVSEHVDKLVELALDAELPPGVLNVVPGRGGVVGQRFGTRPQVRKVGFTGSTAVGKAVLAGCADQLTRGTLELGDRSANVIFADADLAVATASAPAAVFANAGQDCCAGSPRRRTSSSAPSEPSPRSGTGPSRNHQPAGHQQSGEGR